MPNNDKNKENILNSLLTQIDAIPDSQNPRNLFVKAGILEQLASVKKSNPILERSIHFYRQVVFSANAIDDLIFRIASEKCIELMKFRGWQSQLATIWQKLIQRFPLEKEHRRQLGVTYLTIGQDEQAKKVFEEILELDIDDYFAKAHLGFILKSESVSKADLKMLEKAADLIGDAVQNSKEDLEGLFYFHLGDALRRLEKFEKADEIFQLAADRKIFPSFWQRSLYNEENLKAQPIWPLHETKIQNQLKVIKQHWESIRDEALKVYDDKNGGFFIDESESLKDTGYWGEFNLFVQGREKAENCAKTPLTCSLIRNIPEIKSNRRGQVKFSVMKSGTHVHAHSGPTNCRLRAHLGLQVPANPDPNGTKLRVADQILHWQNGEMFVFDDSFDHEVWHNHPENLPRIILILDLWHPELSNEKRATLPAI